ncbi:MAG: RNA polymerase sigma factor [Acidobacteria bacterium]|nr:RNA polymerase sigma factor [Acidobacteriota bacterium]MCG2817366.1 RNA polymerase sigma factor [Candidatus Aminicenantes bacterium]MBU1338818.1 RNA polymerase sigma factor [Acidobacteriota bacterium]MBU1474741.1 RNA polymerase sigma factor [Acidobacteriota bacterium]MBU2438562.1 RNA polymerase sigma factor [Acidobacteriota bacterium]
MSSKDTKIEELERILHQFSNFIYANIYKFNIQSKGIDPEDIFQEVRLKIWNLIENEKDIKNYAFYLRKIINSCIIDKLRKYKRESNIIHLEKKELISEKQNPYHPDENRALKRAQFFSKAVNSLIHSRRKAVKLFLSELTLDEIATVCNWSKDKTRNLLYRGLSDLKKRLIEIGINDEYWE